MNVGRRCGKDTQPERGSALNNYGKPGVSNPGADHPWSFAPAEDRIGAIVGTTRPAPHIADHVKRKSDLHITWY
jgi:hypothetical protein